MADKATVLQGTVDLMVLKTLDAMGSMHGYGVAQRIQQISEDLLYLNQGTLYPALLRLEQRGLIESEYGTSENNRKPGTTPSPKRGASSCRRRSARLNLGAESSPCCDRASSTQVSQLFEKGLERIRSIPNVESAAVVLNLPIDRGMNIAAYVPGSKEPDQAKLTDWRYATPDYFSTLRIPVLAGRVFTRGDGADAGRVAVINRRFVEMYIGAANPIGMSVKLRASGEPCTIIGIVGDTEQVTLAERGPAILYVPMSQAPDDLIRSPHSWFAVQWVIRTRDSGQGVIAAVQREVRGIAPLTPISGFRTIDEVRSEAVKQWRFMMVLVSVFAGLALLLAGAGIYGVISYQVESRRHEMGILLALGATASGLVRSVLWRGVASAAVGVVLGAVLSGWLSKGISSMLFGVKATDVTTIAAAGAFLIGVAAVSSLVPALRITHLDPARALRVE